MIEDDKPDFADLLKGVKRLQNDRVNLYQQRQPKKTVVANPDVNSDRNLKIDTTESVIITDSHFHSGLQKKVQRRIRRGVIRPEASLDLHGCRQREALDLLDAFIGNVIHEGLRMVVIIHGRGNRSENNPVIKPMVQRWLASQQSVLAWCPAQPQDGAAGASYVYLRAKVDSIK
jgi:DNA-nicking Smr family endonuclease